MVSTMNIHTINLKVYAFIRKPSPIVPPPPARAGETAGMERVLAYREVEAILIYDLRIGMVRFWGTDETVGQSEDIYFHRR